MATETVAMIRDTTRVETIITTIAFLAVIGAMSLVLGVVWVCEQIVRWIHG